MILIGTAHTFQRPQTGPIVPAIEEFRCFIRNLCVQNGVRALAEEMNRQALQEHGVQESIAQQLSRELGLIHQFSDPATKERSMLGIRSENDIRIEGWIKRWSQKEIDKAVIQNANSDRVREGYWFLKLLEIDTWPILFICGADHFSPFSSLLRKADVTVVEACKDWSPCTKP